MTDDVPSELPLELLDTVPAGLPKVQFEVAVMSRLGGRRVNEDACGHWHSDHHLCCVVADGVGGHGGGDRASRFVVQHVITRYAATPVRDGPAVEALLRATNEALRGHRADAVEQHDMYSTVVALFVELDKQQALWAHVGDSRLYVLRERHVLLRTQDHSVVQMLVAYGSLAEEQVHGHPHRSELLCALGSEPEALQVGLAPRSFDILPGDVFLMCTDGLWDHVSDDVLEQTVGSVDDPEMWLERLEAELLREVAEEPRHDNYSAIALWARAVD